MKCFICNKILVRSKTNILTECETHDEHIIQNALRGELKSEKILCKGCGNDLNRQIDSPFINFFSPINELFKKHMRKKDHSNNNKSVAIIGRIFDGALSEFKVNYKNGVISPERPYHSEINFQDKEVTIFANLKSISSFESKVKKKIYKEGYNPEDFSIKKIHTYDDRLFIPLIGENICNLSKVINLGYNKIATEFALMNGIDRLDLTRTLKINQDGKGEIIFSNNVFDYFPNGITESIYEEFRPLLEPNYPSHTVMLFTQENKNGMHTLYCYIDLYSTFQAYVILNENYNTDRSVNKHYHQSVLIDSFIDKSIEETLQSSISKSYESITKVFYNNENLNPVEATVKKKINGLSRGMKKSLEKELEAIEDSIINQSMRQEIFSPREHYDLTWLYKKIFFSPEIDDFKSIPKYILNSSAINDKATGERIKNYYRLKLQQLLISIQIADIYF